MDEAGARRATARPIVLPLRNRSLVVTDSVCWGILGVAMAAAAALILYLNRGTSFFPDEIEWIYATPGLNSASDVLEPHHGHLIATTRLAYKAILETVGAEYVVFRVLAVLAVLLSAGLFYAVAKRRVGAVVALAPTLVLLFLGSAPVHVGSPVGFTPVFSIAAGLGALLVLERGDWRPDRRRDVAACALITLSVATYSTGLAFLGGIAVAVLLRPGRLRRAWIFLVPLALYVAWWLWATTSESSSSGAASLFNILLIPNWVAESLATVTAALTGLGYRFVELPSPSISLEWGRILAVLAVVALALRIRRGNLPASLWISLGVVLAYWSLGGLVAGSFARTPEAIRFIYPGSVGVLLVATAAATGIRFSRLGLAVLFIAVSFSVATNIALLRDGTAHIRNNLSDTSRAYFAVLELARGHVDPGFVATPPQVSPLEDPVTTYFAVADRYGSPAFSVSELEREDETVRQAADVTLASALGLRLQASSAPRAGEGCRRVGEEQRRAPLAIELPRGGASLRTRAPGPAAVTLARFADFAAVQLGELSPGQAATLTIPPDSSPRPWRATVAGASSVEVCALR